MGEELHFCSESITGPRSDLDNKKTFSSGATSAHGAPPYQLCTWVGFHNTSLRFGYGNVKHEDNTTILAEANWLKAFHARDLEFFQDRFSHAIMHIVQEVQGRFDPAPGGNLGAVGWFVEITSYLAKYDPDFYMAVVGRERHPGTRETPCPCPRCTNDPS